MNSTPYTSVALGTPAPFNLTATEIIRTSTLGAATLAANPTLQAEATALQQTQDAMTPVCLPGYVTVWYMGYITNIMDAFEEQGINAIVDVYGQSYTDDCKSSEMATMTYLLATSDEQIEQGVLDEIIPLLRDYPPRETPFSSPAIINLRMGLSDDEGQWIGENNYTFTYHEAIAAYESGLRGEALLAALGIELPE